MDKYKEDERYIVPFKQLERLSDIPEGIKAVDGHKNQISFVDVDKDNRIEYMDLSDNSLRDMNSLASLKHLITLDCGFNMLTKIVQLDGGKLEQLYLMCNYIETIENISYPRMKILDVAGNEIEKIENIVSPDLEDLYLSSNRIRTVECLSDLLKLKILDLSYNQIESIDCHHLPQSLETLLLHGNHSLVSIENIDHLRNLKMIGVKKTPMAEAGFPEAINVWA
jgi:protein phosphatase 1 regulatory subunit 7